MWHASTRSLLPPSRKMRPTLLRAAYKALDGCGDKTAGEWRTTSFEKGGGMFVHVQRRLTPMEEQHLAEHVDEPDLLVDIRGTDRHVAIAHQVASETSFEAVNLYAIDAGTLPKTHPDDPGHMTDQRNTDE